MEKEIIMRYVEQARDDYRRIMNTPERYRKEHSVQRAEAKLVQIECLAIELGYISTGTI